MARPELLDRLTSQPMIFAHRGLAHKIGLHEAILLQVLIYWYKYFKDNGKLILIRKTSSHGFEDDEYVFFTTDKFLGDRAALSTDQVARCRKKLKSRGLIRTTTKGAPQLVHYIIQEEAVHKLLDSLSVEEKDAEDKGCQNTFPMSDPSASL
jgi:hypothetical protein